MRSPLIALEFHVEQQGQYLGTWLKLGLRNSSHQEEVVVMQEQYFRAEIN